MKRRRLWTALERLERRVCLTVNAVLQNGDLVVTGDADGDVQITALSATQYEVTDNGQSVAVLDGVTDDIRVRLDATAGADNAVDIDLNGQSVDQISVRLGDGTNSLKLEGGTARSLYYRGGAGADSVSLSDTATIDRTFAALLGGGDNQLDVNGQVGGNLLVLAGSGADLVSIGPDAQVGGSVGAALGDGANQFTLEGTVDGCLELRLGIDDDLVQLMAESQVGGRVSVQAGDGANQLQLDGTVLGGVDYRGGSGDDTVNTGADSVVGGSVHLRLGDGDNTVTHDGQISGDLVVRSANPADLVTINGTVDGATDSQPGTEDFGRRFGFGHHGRNHH